MCKGYSDVHKECNHIKQFVITELCIYGVDEQGQCAGSCTYVLYQRDILWPSLCLNCRQRGERAIFERFEQEIGRLETMIESVKWNRRAEPDASVRADMRAEISSLEAQAGDARDERSEELNEFRTLQGVWGDG